MAWVTDLVITKFHIVSYVAMEPKALMWLSLLLKAVAYDAYTSLL